MIAIYIKRYICIAFVLTSFCCYGEWNENLVGVDKVVHQDGEFQSSAFLTLDTLSSTSKGRMSPITTTVLLSKSTLYEVTPVFEEIKEERN
jgi:hypothetical protein